MRYFRYPNPDQTINNAFKAQYKTLTEDEKRTFRAEKRWRKLGVLTSLTLCICLIALGMYLLKCIPLPPPSAWFGAILVIVAKAFLGFLWLGISGLLTAVLTMGLWKKVESFHLPSMKKEIFSKACKHLREYYRLQEPYIITKCFDATDKKFRNHDVCIFIAGEELRITTDLVRGFLHGERDLGCYGFRRDEILLSKAQKGKHLTVQLRADDTVFLLGYRAKGFVEKHFLAAPLFPRELDGAEVLYYTSRDDYGAIEYPNGEVADHYRYLAICKYPKENLYYLFCCDETFEVVNDWPESSVEECMKAAARSYRENIIWNKID